jgi:two-component system OmpR family sensor kinase
MFTSLRARLWLTYAIIIILILAIVGLGIFVYIIRNPVVDRQAIQRLDFALTLMKRQLNERNISLEHSQDYINRISDSLTIRALLFDSEKNLLIDTQPDSSSILLPSVGGSKTSRGRINDQGGATWLYVSWTYPKGEVLILATPRQGGIQLIRSSQLRQILKEDFLPAFLRAGLIAFVLAIIFAVWMGNWITSPLQEIEHASLSVSQGEYRQIPPKGPDEVQALANAYNEMVDRVQASQQSQRDFVANVSHELKTPLTSIQGFSQAIQDGTVQSGEALARAAGIIHTEAERMYRLVVDLLDLARFDAGTLEFDRKALDLNRILKHVVNQLIPQAAQAQVQLTLKVNALPTIVGDEDRLAQVFTNIVDNAIKHTPVGGDVSVLAFQESDFAVIKISDSGEGIPEDQLSRIFERFYKIDGSRKKDGEPGTGLGLAIAQQIIQAHAGVITVQSDIGAGSEFEVRIPIVKADDQTISVMSKDSILS